MGVVYDKAKYHFEGEYPANLSRQQAFVHTGFFVGWLADHNLLSSDIITNFSEELRQFKERRITGPRLYEILGGVLDEGMLNQEGNRFAQFYFDFDKGRFVSDYLDLLASELPTFYHVSDTWSNYEQLAEKINERFHDWQISQSSARPV